MKPRPAFLPLNTKAVRRLSLLIARRACLPALLLIGTSCTSPVVSDSAMDFAKERVVAEVGDRPREGSLVVVDYSKPSSEKRMTVIDLKTGRAKMNSLVAHGVNSGLLYATDFSDRVGSNQSSLGLYKVGEEYWGKHGRSLRLDGLDPGFNRNARKRAIVVHAADYVSQEAMDANRHEFGRLGRSAGCLSLSDEDMDRLGRKMKRPAYIFAYAPTMVAKHEYPEVQGEPLKVSPTLASTASKPAPPVESPAVARPALPAPVDEDGMILLASIERPAASGNADGADGATGTRSSGGRGLVGVAGAASRSLASTVSRVNFIPSWN